METSPEGLSMNRSILAAAALSALTLAAHFFGGGPQYHTPAMASSLSIEDKTVYTVIWHAVTAILVINTLAFAHATYSRKFRTGFVFLTSAQYLSWGFLFVYFGLTRLGDLWTLPQWIAFFLIPAVAIWGLKESTQK